MSNLRRALLISVAATGAVVIGWSLVSRWSERMVRHGSARAHVDLTKDRSRADEIEALSTEQQALMLRELSGQV